MEDRQESAATEGNKKKKDKFRSAWISFAGRIVAQLVGAAATVALGVTVLHRYTASDNRPPVDAAAPVAVPAQAGHGDVHVIVITPEMLALRDGDDRIRPADRGCAAPMDTPSASAAHLNQGSILQR